MYKDEVNPNVQERVSEPIVRSRLSKDDISHMQWNVLLGKSSCRNRSFSDGFAILTTGFHSPLQIELASTGSVGVTHAPMTRHSRYVKPGIKPHMSRLVTNQAKSMTGPRSVTRLSHSRRRYAFGNAIPGRGRKLAVDDQGEGDNTGEEDLDAYDDPRNLIREVVWVGRPLGRIEPV